MGGGQRGTRHLLYQDTIGAICARDYKGVGNEYVEEDKLIIEVVNHARAEDTEVCPTLPAAMGMGGGYVPMIVQEQPTIIANGSTIKIDRGGGGIYFDDPRL